MTHGNDNICGRRLRTDLESVISASVAAKKAQLQQPITTKKTNTQITLTGVGQLKSGHSTFTTTLAKMSTDGAFNKRAINITQDKMIRS